MSRNKFQNNNVLAYEHFITKEQRAIIKNQKPFIIWFTGLSGSGKSTLANALESKLYELNYNTYLLDGDNVRQGLTSDLKFDKDSRIENIRRIGEVAKLFVKSGTIVITAFISPFIEDRERVRNIVEKREFIEIFVDTPLEICETRDPKGLYKKARQGELKNFMGIDSPYEKTMSPELCIDNTEPNFNKNINKIINYLQENGYIKNVSKEKVCKKI
ncbi:adenylyl-sulfate kinase [Arcobacter sp. HD9-500m-PIT-SAG03]|nr:adenylyl-sulfate kinase [Arcobacter sp. HD9-500m-PIT-SAG03]